MIKLAFATMMRHHDVKPRCGPGHAITSPWHTRIIVTESTWQARRAGSTDSVKLDFRVLVEFKFKFRRYGPDSARAPPTMPGTVGVT